MAGESDAAREAIFKRVAEIAPNASADQLRDLAEALAWAITPNQSH